MTETTSEAITASIPVIHCELCPTLCKSRSRIVNGRGPEDAKIMVVGNGPDFADDKSGKPFTGQGGQFLAQMLWEAGIAPSNVRLTNATRCRAPGNRAPSDKEIAECNPYLMEEIKQVKPKVIIAVGASAIHALLGKHKVGDVAGQVMVELETGTPVVPTYNPAYLMNSKWGLMPLVVTHMEKALQISQGTLDMQPVEEAQKSAITVRTLPMLRKLAEYLTSDEVSIVVSDTETTGLSWLDDELLCFSFSALDSNYKAIRAGFAIPFMKADRSLWPTTAKGKPK